MTQQQKLELVFTLKHYLEYDSCASIYFEIDSNTFFSATVSKRGFLITTLGSSIFTLDSHIRFEDPMNPTEAEMEMQAMLSGRGQVLINAIKLAAILTREQRYYRRQIDGGERVLRVARLFVTDVEDGRKGYAGQ